jgi:8-oxo-dGTP diphosphatase
MSNSPGKYGYEFPRPGVTADIVVLTRDPQPEVLLIRRKEDPFAGHCALPGGFLNEDETLADAARRELHEETGVSGVELEQVGAFGDPGRDPRGWTVTVAFLARVDRSAVKPKAGDDAAAVKWHPLDKLPKTLAFDHDKILARALARLTAFGA